MSTYYTARRIRYIADRLEEAGAEWPIAALGIEQIDSIAAGNLERRDSVTLRREWAMEVNDRMEVVVCPPTMYRTEAGQWCAVGWSNASAGMLYRPGGVVFDEDAGTFRADGDCDLADGWKHAALARLRVAGADETETEAAIRGALRAGVSPEVIAQIADCDTARVRELRA